MFILRSLIYSYFVFNYVDLASYTVPLRIFSDAGIAFLIFCNSFNWPEFLCSRESDKKYRKSEKGKNWRRKNRGNDYRCQYDRWRNDVKLKQTNLANTLTPVRFYWIRNIKIYKSGKLILKLKNTWHNTPMYDRLLTRSSIEEMVRAVIKYIFSIICLIRSLAKLKNIRRIGLET